MAFYSRIGSFKTIAWCSGGTSLVGFFLMVCGAIITGIAFTELTPPDWDQNYDRYTGSDLKRIMGPILIATGALILFGSCGLFVYAFISDKNEEYSRPGTPNLQHKYTSPSVTVAKAYDEEEDLDIEKQ